MARRCKGDAKTIFSVASGNFLEMYDFAASLIIFKKGGIYERQQKGE